TLPTHPSCQSEWGRHWFISPQVGYVYTFAPVHLDLREEWSWTWTLNSVEEVRLPPGTQIVVEGDLVAEGVTFTQAEQWHPWGGIVVAGTGTDPASVTLDDVTVEHADAGLTVYQFGTADMTESTFQDNGIGLDVRSNSGVTVSGSAFDGNGYGVTSGFIEVFGSYDLCISSLCRSAFTLLGPNSFVTDNGATGIYAHNTEARIELTEISGNGSAGLAIANADVNPFQNNVI